MLVGVLVLVMLMGVISVATGVRPRHFGFSRHDHERVYGGHGLAAVAISGLLFISLGAIEHFLLLGALVLVVVFGLLVAGSVLVRRTRR